ncbi:dynamin-binding protein-like [Mizuhopecten yessoensis]|uniref:Dynamin-binding protein n=1 Tax=Mizuhopecten yessoensis TaxID=6573 RepID=A0A210R218_MIZYE|nr:dynamin-binding protein-like [Mizuhopecten yessoensis]XP_021378132.1 dynamin-binding protein-like [Mizuhopecten yessoensis]XP_021378138.1 dynamin-binding protein-like [Mizuhopecten yessoensis]OWF54976.1 Dynamin-binding protein [Mizuhopecten yessoensis]
MKPDVSDYVDQYVRAVYDFNSTQRGEINLSKGEIIRVSSVVDSNWLRGRKGDIEGSFPVSFVEKICLPAVQLGQKVFGATENFPSQEQGDLQFKKGVVVIGLHRIDDNWWEGKSGGHNGIFPLTHVMELEVPSSLRERSKSVHSSEPMFARALRDSVAQLDEELGFKAGDMITIKEVVDADWYIGELGSRSGMFLASCVELLQDTTAQDDHCKTDSHQDNSRQNSSAAEVNNVKSKPYQPNSSLHKSDTNSVGPTDNTVSTTNSNVSSDADLTSRSTSHESDITPYARTLYPFVGQSDDELTFRGNEMVYLIQHVDDQWIEGELEGKTGLFPASYVSIIVDCPYASGPVSTDLSSVDQSSNQCSVIGGSEEVSEGSVDPQLRKTESVVHKFSGSDPKVGRYGLVKFTFVEENSGDLSVMEGDTVLILKLIDENWVMAQDDRGKEGICPKSFVEIFDDSPDFQPQGKSVTESVRPVVDEQLAGVQVYKSPMLSKHHSLNEISKNQNIDKPKSLVKPLVSPKPTLKPKPALLPKPVGPMKATFLSRVHAVEESSSMQRSPSSPVLQSAMVPDANSKTKSSSTCELDRMGLGQPPRWTDGPAINKNLDFLIAGEMEKAMEETRSRSSSIQSTTSSGSSVGSVTKDTEAQGSLAVPMRAKRPPPPSQTSINQHRHTVNFPVTFDSSATQQPRFSKQNSLATSPGLNSGNEISVGNSTFFTDVLIPDRKIPVMRKPPPPQRTASIDTFDRKLSLRKPPPPRPTVPRGSSQDTRTGKTVPHRSAPRPPKNVRVPSRPAPPTPSQMCPPPPKRPPPRRPLSEEAIEKYEANAEIIRDLRNRIQEVEQDLENCRKCKGELEVMLYNSPEEDRAEVYDNVEFYDENIKGLTDELQNLRETLQKLSPEEMDAVEQQMAEEKQRQEEEKRQIEEKKKQEELMQKRKEKRSKVIEELVHTEKDFLQSLHLCMETFLNPLAEKHLDVDIELIFGNMEEIAEVSQRLLTMMEEAVCAREFQDIIIGPCFTSLAEDMKNVYAPYCRNHDDVIMVMERYHTNPSINEYFERMLDILREQSVVFDVGALLIKPVQRILKYPLLLNELIKTTEEGHKDKLELLDAINTMTDVAAAINEYKRRKDLVYKYKKITDETLGDKLAKLSLHSLKKKGSRFKGRLSTSIGLSPQTKDETFDKEESRFRLLEKIVRIFVRDIQVYMEQVQESMHYHESLVVDVEDFYEEVPNVLLIEKYKQVHNLIESQFLPGFVTSVTDQVISPLERLVQFFIAPNKVIQKRYDKLLDYDSMLRKSKDDKSLEKALGTTKKDYEAMNAQLLDELPSLYSLSLSLLQDCVAAFVSAQQAYADDVLHRMSELLDLSSLLCTDHSVMDVFNHKHVSIVDRMSLLSFIPKGFNPRMELIKQDKKAKQKTMDVADKECGGQSDSQRMYVTQKYPSDKLYIVNEKYTPTDTMDIPLLHRELVGVVMEKDPLGNKDRWFVDNGASKGFVPKNILTLYQSTAPQSYSPPQTSTTVTRTCSILEPVPVGGERGTGLAAANVEDDEFDFALEEDMSPEITEEINVSSSSGSEEFYFAEFGFEARTVTEVSMFEGQVVTVLAKHDQEGNTEWWHVDADGLRGYAPSIYLKPMS